MEDNFRFQSSSFPPPLIETMDSEKDNAMKLKKHALWFSVYNVDNRPAFPRGLKRPSLLTLKAFHDPLRRKRRERVPTA